MTGRRGEAHGLRLSPAAVRDGVWIDVGEWVKSEGHGHHVWLQSPPIIMRRTDHFTEAEARKRGWLL